MAALLKILVWRANAVVSMPMRQTMSSGADRQQRAIDVQSAGSRKPTLQYATTIVLHIFALYTN